MDPNSVSQSAADDIELSSSLNGSLHVDQKIALGVMEFDT